MIKRSQLLSSILAFGLVSSQPPSIADEVQIKLVEKDVHEFVKTHGTTNPDYPQQLAFLASIYLKHGKAKQAEETFKKAIETQKTFRNPDYVIPGMMLNWAFELVPHDISKANQTLLAGLESANRMPFGSKERLDYLYGMITFYKQVKQKAQEEAQIKLLDEQLRALEKADGLQDQHILVIAQTLSKMADLYVLPSSRLSVKTAIQKMEVIGDRVAAKPNSVRERDFKLAEVYQLRAIEQYGKLLKDQQLQAHIALRAWYDYYGQTKQSQNESRILDRLNNGPEWRKLQKTRKRQPCHGCGMG